MPDSYVPTDLRRLVSERAGGCCEYCRSQARFSPQPFSVEHIHPRSEGGETVPENLALACQGCNGHKYTKTVAVDPIMETEVPLFHPRRDRWRDHFAWSADATRIVGLTPVGRTTVESLRMNREALVNLRRVLFAMEEHPPAEDED
jgi:hypothetical protein